MGGIEKMKVLGVMWEGVMVVCGKSTEIFLCLGVRFGN